MEGIQAVAEPLRALLDPAANVSWCLAVPPETATDLAGKTVGSDYEAASGNNSKAPHLGKTGRAGHAVEHELASMS